MLQIGQAPRTVLVMRAVSCVAAVSATGAAAVVLKSPSGSIRFVMEILENIGQGNQRFYELKLATNT
jgi:hypothetical protein